ncbi:hypothetical protein QYE76_049039 [Lolium multiflorum]|uniref:DUF4283 domain-containing protein n=1 Tax=Lolium multiflorum TaxID=4521 RepID=A0AAD8WHY0_LOLMU|nr:hypothetical protein QYE76_049039 [Lolium multiflorum]
MSHREGTRASSFEGSSQGGGIGGSGPKEPRTQGMAASGPAVQEHTGAFVRPVGLLMAPPRGGGDQGGLAERPTHPKPTGGAAANRLPRRAALMGADTSLEGDGNWNDGNIEEEMGFRRGVEAQIGGVVDMEDDLYMEFEEEEEIKLEPVEKTSWTLLARYMASFKPNTKAMFKYFIDEAWRLRKGIEYSEKGKNYYMFTLFSKGDYDFVMRGGPWIFNQNALLVKGLNDAAQPSEIVLNSVPVWVRIYDVPWGKQTEVWGRRYGDGLGKTLEVDVPATEQDKKEFLRVRVELPYSRRLQTQIVTGVKGKPQEVKVFKLKYERVPYYCSHCGFMGHKKDECEKKRLGAPSMDYEVYELRCSPYKKFEHRTFFAQPASQAAARRELSYSSFGSAESFKRFEQRRPGRTRRDSVTPDYANGRSDTSENAMPPLEEEFAAPQQADAPLHGVPDGGMQEVAPAMQEVESDLAEQVGALVVEQAHDIPVGTHQRGHDASKPIIQFPEEDGQGETRRAGDLDLKLSVTEDMLINMQRLQARRSASASYGTGSFGPRHSDMIPALQGLSSLQVSFGSVNDVSMVPADTILGKRLADEQEVEGGCLELSLGLDYGSKQAGGTPKKGRTQEDQSKPQEQRSVEKFYRRNKKVTSTGHKPTGNLTGPNVWSRQEQ